MVGAHLTDRGDLTLLIEKIRRFQQSSMLLLHFLNYFFLENVYKLQHTCKDDIPIQNHSPIRKVVAFDVQPILYFIDHVFNEFKANHFLLTQLKKDNTQFKSKHRYINQNPSF